MLVEKMKYKNLAWSAMLMACSSIGHAQPWIVSAPIPWGVQATHMITLPSGHVLVWNNGISVDGEFSYTQASTLFKFPEGSDFTDLPADENDPNYSQYVERVPLQIPGANSNLFCASHLLMDDAKGTVYISGGDFYHYRGSRSQFLFQEDNPNHWQRLADMEFGKWYPEMTMTPRGQILVTMGSADIEDPGRYPEETPSRSYQVTSLDPSTLTSMATASYITSSIPFQRRSWSYQETTPQHIYFPNLVPIDEDTLWAGGNRYDARKFNITTTSFDINRFPNNPGLAFQIPSIYPSTCMMIFPDKRIVLRGGGSYTSTNAVNTVIGINLDSSFPTWAAVPSMAAPRKNHFFVALPTGKVLAIGGNVVGLTQYNGDDLPQRTPEVYTPGPGDNYFTGSWMPQTPMAIPRPYHSTVSLLPDGRILMAGGEPTDPSHPQKSAELVTPDYCQGIRPEIKSAPDVAFYGDEMKVRVLHEPDRVIKRATIITFSSATHSRLFGQRFIVPVELSRSDINLTESELVLKTPVNFEATPGWYMLFVEDSAGKVSRSKVMRITSHWTRNIATEFKVTGAQAQGGKVTDIQQNDACYGKETRRIGEYRISCGDISTVTLNMKTKLPLSVMPLTALRMRMEAFFIGDSISLIGVKVGPDKGNMIDCNPINFDLSSSMETSPAEIEQELTVAGGGDFSRSVNANGTIELQLTFKISGGTLAIDELALNGWQNFAP